MRRVVNTQRCSNMPLGFRRIAERRPRMSPPATSRCGARTRACRVETRLDTLAETLCLHEWRHGTHECVRHVIQAVFLLSLLLPLARAEVNRIVILKADGLPERLVERHEQRLPSIHRVFRENGA